MGQLTVARPRQKIYDLDICAFPWQFEGTGPQFTANFRCWPGTSADVTVEGTESAWKVEDLTEIEKADTTDATSHSASDTFRDSNDQTSTRARGDLTLALERLIRERTPSEFASFVKNLDWSAQRPGELNLAIDLALREEMANLAIELAQLGKRLFPQNERVQRAARVLAPPIARPTHLPPTEGLKASRQWLREHTSEYRGRWVAVRDGELMAVGTSMKELETVIDPGQDNLDILITKVL